MKSDLRACAAIALIFVFGFSFDLRAQEEDAHCAVVGYVPVDILDRPLKIRKGVGRVLEKPTTESKEARAFYQQGVAYLHSYVWVEATRSFNQALRLDPKLALAHVGLSRAYSGLGDSNAANDALKQAEALKDGCADWEKRRIDLRGKQLKAMADSGNEELHEEYKAALDDALAKDLDDPELWLLRGNAEERAASGRGQGGRAASVAFYRRALELQPDSFAAHHYLVHTYENIGEIDRALEHGENYAKLAYNVPHAHHMWGHDLRRAGRVQDAIREFKTALDLEERYYAAENISREFDWHHQHNLDLLAGCYHYEGQHRMAEELMSKIFAVNAIDSYREYSKKEWPAYLLSRGRNEEALAAAKEMTEFKDLAARTIGHVLAGQAALALGQTDEAWQQLAIAQLELDKPGEESGGRGRGSVDPYVKSLMGELLLRGGKHEEARPVMKELQSKLRAAPGPDAWIQALFKMEGIARVAREAGDWELAEYTAQQMMEHDPAYAGSHYALALVQEHKGEREAARESFAKAAKLWSRADEDLAELRDIRARTEMAGN